MKPSGKPLSLTVSIVTYNSERTIRATLDSLLQEIPKHIVLAVTVIDNGSTDCTIPILEDYLAGGDFVKLVRPERNLGYGRGHNLAIADATSKYHLISNPDVAPCAGSVPRLLQFLEDHTEVGIVCPRFVNPDGTLQPLNKRYPSVLDFYLRRFAP